MKQSSFAAPHDLKDTTFNLAAPDALDEFGTTPENISVVLATTKRSKRSNHLPTPTPAVVAIPSKSVATAPKPKLSSTFPPMPTKVPTVFGGSNKSAAVTNDTNLNRSSRPSTPALKGEGSSTNDSFSQEDAESKSSSFGNMSAMGASMFSPGAMGAPPIKTQVNLFGSLSAPSSGAAVEANLKFGPEKRSLTDYLTILTLFYRQHDPSKAQTVPKLLEKYKVCPLTGCWDSCFSMPGVD